MLFNLILSSRTVTWIFFSKKLGRSGDGKRDILLEWPKLTYVKPLQTYIGFLSLRSI